MPRALIAAASLALLVLIPAAAHSSTTPAPSARVGAFYFDGWAAPVTNYHFGGLIGTKFSRRRPLSGWRDNTPEALQAQLRWAHADGIGFFAFDWYYNTPEAINAAHDTYLKLRNHDGVGFALNYVNMGDLWIPPDQWAGVAEAWVTQDFLNPDYVRIDGKPLLIIIDEHNFNVQMGGATGVNAAIETLQEVARRHGLPGVFVVGGRFLNWASEQCFPNCLDTDRDFALEHYDAITEYGYPYILEPRDGPRRYSDVAPAIKRMWQVFAQRSPFPDIPSVMAGLDARPMILAGQIQAPDKGGWPLLNGHRTWFVTTPAEVGGLLRYAVSWVQAHPSVRVEPAPSPPVVMLESWNELQEGAIIVPTEQNGYGYGQAIAKALGVPWAPLHEQALRVVASRRGTVKSSPARIFCPPRCTSMFAGGVQVSLTARAKRGFRLDHWKGCTDTDPTCSVVLVRDSTVQPVFVATR